MRQGTLHPGGVKVGRVNVLSSWPLTHALSIQVAVKILLTHKNHGKKLEKVGFIQDHPILPLADSLIQRLRREINVWARCRHINVVPLLGKTLPFPGASIVGMVSPWMHHGNLHDYLGQHINSLCFISRFNIVSI